MHGEGFMVLLVAGQVLAGALGAGSLIGALTLIAYAERDRERVQRDLAVARKTLLFVGVVAAAIFAGTVAEMTLLHDADAPNEERFDFFLIGTACFLIALLVIGLAGTRALGLAAVLRRDAKRDAA